MTKEEGGDEIWEDMYVDWFFKVRICSQICFITVWDFCGDAFFVLYYGSYKLTPLISFFLSIYLIQNIYLYVPDGFLFGVSAQTFVWYSQVLMFLWLSNVWK